MNREILQEKLEQHFEKARHWRRHFHQHPEASTKEIETSKTIFKELEAMGLHPEFITATGLICDIQGKKKRPLIALRADIDALDLTELSQKDYASQNPGLMHACGHDAHIASLLYCAQILSEIQDHLPGSIRLIFQPAEEVAKGAKEMIKQGAMDKVEAILGIHVWNDVPLGRINIAPGTRMASGAQFSIEITGKGGHGALPNQGVDALVCGASTVMNLQTLVSREIHPLEPAVVTTGILHSGSRFNILAETAYLEGTTRCYSSKISDHLEEAIKRIAQETASSFRAKAKVDYEVVVKATINDEKLTQLARESATKLFGEEVLYELDKLPVGEDFSFYGDYAPAIMAFVGTKNEDKLAYYPHHHPKFDLDEEGLRYAAGLYTQFALDALDSLG